jgi:hypothetical protein
MRKILFIFVIFAIWAGFCLSKNGNSAIAGFGTPTPTPTPADLTNCKAKTYQDKFVAAEISPSCVDKIRIKGVLFIAKDQTAGVKSYWSTNMIDIFGKIKTLYESQFNNLINISWETPAMIYGDNNIEEYNAGTAPNSIMNEAKQKANYISSEYYVIYMIYVVTGVNGKYASSMGGWKQGATQGAFWLDPENLGGVTSQYGTDYSGYKGSAHEFGHTLAIPHPWEEEQNKDSNGNILNPSYGNDEQGSIMSYGGQMWPNAFIRQTVKGRMIIPAETPTPTSTPALTPTSTPIPTCQWWESCGQTPTPTPTPTSTPTPTFVMPGQAIRFDSDPMVYVFRENKIKWVPNPDVFNGLGLNWGSIEIIPANQKSNFQRAKLLRAENDEKVFYITEGGLKRHIPNIETFNSYGNLWQDIISVKPFELLAITDNQLIRQSGDSKVYKLENGQKRWIKTAETFNRLGLNWTQIAPVNSVEINSYPEGSAIE